MILLAEKGRQDDADFQGPTIQPSFYVYIVYKLSRQHFEK